MMKKLFVFLIFPLMLFSQPKNALPKYIKGNWFDSNKSNVWRYGFQDSVIYANGQFLYDYSVSLINNKETLIKINNKDDIIVRKDGVSKISVSYNSESIRLSKNKSKHNKYTPQTDGWARNQDFRPDTIIIQGIIKDYNKLKNPPKQIELTIRQIHRSAWKEKKLKVNKYGVFYYKHYLTEPMVAVHIGPAVNIVFASPGDTISLYVDSRFMWEGIKLLAFKNELNCEFGGNGIDKSIEYNHYLPVDFRGKFRENSLEDQRKEKSPFEYLEMNKTLMEKRLKKAGWYFKNNISSEYFKSYVYTDIVYGRAYEVLSSKLYSIKDVAERDSFFYQATNLSNRLLDFIDKPIYCENFSNFVKNEIDYKYSRGYAVPIEDFRKYVRLEQVVDIDKKLAQDIIDGLYDKSFKEINVYTKNSLPEVDSFVVRNKDYITTLLNYCQLENGLKEIQKKYTQSHATDYLLNYISTIRFHYHKDTIPSEFLLMMSKMTTNDKLIAHIKHENDKLKVILDELSKKRSVALEDNSIFCDTSKIISNLLANYSDKPIYIDFWATWCGPCRTELANCKRLHELFKDKLEFVYICCNSNRKEFEVLAKEYDLQGKHFFVSDNKQVKDLQTFFKARGFPTYFIIDRNGKIEYAPRPSDTKGLSELITKINGG